MLEGRTIPVHFPVVAPTFKQSTEIVPRAELEAALVAANEINRQIASTVVLPPELQTAQLNFDLQAIEFQRVDAGAEEDLRQSIPPIPALLLIPGNIGFLNQFFSVQVFTENAAPAGSGLSVNNVKARRVLRRNAFRRDSRMGRRINSAVLLTGFSFGLMLPPMP